MHENFERRRPAESGPNRSFGFVMAGALGVISALAWWRSGTLPVWLVAIAAAFFVFAVIRPAALRPIERVWMRLGLALHAITTPILLGVIYFVVLTPVARVARLVGHVWLPLAKDPEAATYWQPRNPSSSSSMANQY